MRVVSAVEVEPEPYYDFHVPDGNSYSACGLWHHNCGKTFAASVGVCRVLYELSCMRDPHASYHMAKGTPIHIVCFSVTEELAIKVAFDNIIEKIQASPYFTEKFGYRPGKKEYRFPNKITLAARATTDTSALGLNVISAFIDEGNFLPQPGKARRLAGEKDKAETIYNQLKRRMKSRYQRHGKLPGMMFVVSSKRRTDDFTSKLVRSSRADPTVAVFDYSLWEVKPDNYSSIRFTVFVGNEAIPSKILDDAEVARYVELAKDKENTALLSVPIDFRDDFERDLEASIRDIAGVATVSIAPFIQRREKIREAAEFGDQNGLAHPFSVVEFTPGVGGEFLWDKMVAPVRRKLASGAYETLIKPRINPDAVRHCHIDPSLVQDRTGVAVGHIAGYKEVTRRTAQHQTYLEKAPVIVVDLLLRVVPPVGDEILLGDVRDLIYQMRDHGYQFGMVTMDGHQSADGMQQFRARGIPSDLLSVDRKSDPYDCLKTALYEGRVIFYTYPKLLEELRTLEKNHQTGKVDHPPGGCFVGPTRIPLLDGTFPMIEELAGREVWVLSSTPEGGFVPGLARGRYTKHVTELVDVILDSGAVERCTPEHLWMLRDGTYKAASELRPGIDRLMPVTRSWPVNGGYERLSNRDGARVLTHHMVYCHDRGPIPDDHVIHHKNHDKIDNRPENLEAVTRGEHGREHTALRHETSPEWVAKLRAGGREFNESAEGRAVHSSALRRTMAGFSPEQFRQRSRNHGAFRRDIELPSLTALRDNPEAENANAVGRLLGCGRNVVVRVLREHGHESWEAFKAAEPGDNHKVRAVIPVHLDVPVPVYDLEVDEWSNFALASGVFVHNSKDIADALAGLVFSLTEQQPIHSIPLAMIQGSAEPTPKALWTDEDSYLRPPVSYDVPAPIFDAPLGGPLPFISGDDGNDDFQTR